MGRRRKIGLLFEDFYGDIWTGGLYYLFNIIGALNRLEYKPVITIFYHNPSSIDKVKSLNYDGKMKFKTVRKKISFGRRILNKISRVLFNKNHSYINVYRRDTVDFIFPCGSYFYDYNESLRKLKKIYWIPDFQHKYLPNFFSAEELKNR